MEGRSERRREGEGWSLSSLASSLLVSLQVTLILREGGRNEPLSGLQAPSCGTSGTLHSACALVLSDGRTFIYAWLEDRQVEWVVMVVVAKAKSLFASLLEWRVEVLECKCHFELLSPLLFHSIPFPIPTCPFLPPYFIGLRLSTLHNLSSRSITRSFFHIRAQFHEPSTRNDSASS